MQNLRSFFMESFLEENRFQARFNLGESGGKARTAGEILTKSSLSPAEISEKFLNIKLNDSPNWGRWDLREIVASFHPGAKSENVLITTGTSEALFLLFHVLKPKKLALAIPGFQLLYEIPQALGAEVVPLPVYWNEIGTPFIDENQWIDILNQEKPDCILINNPHNPSGLILSDNFLEAIKNLAKKWGAYVIGDEHYRFLASETDTLGSTIYEDSPFTFVTGSFIKCFGVPGLRIGWCVGDSKILSLMQNEKNYTTHTVSPITEWISYEVLKNTQSMLFQEIKQEWIYNKNCLNEFLQSSQHIYGVKPQGGLVTSLGFKNTNSMLESMKYIELLKQNGIFVLPLSAMEVGSFDFQKSLQYGSKKLSNINVGYGFRLGLGIATSDLKNALILCEHTLNNS